MYFLKCVLGMWLLYFSLVTNAVNFIDFQVINQFHITSRNPTIMYQVCIVCFWFVFVCIWQGSLFSIRILVFNFFFFLEFCQFFVFHLCWPHNIFHLFIFLKYLNQISAIFFCCNCMTEFIRIICTWNFHWKEAFTNNNKLNFFSTYKVMASWVLWKADFWIDLLYRVFVCKSNP